MQNYAPGSAVKLSFDLRNEQGEALSPTALRWRVLDEAQTVLQDWTAIALPSPPQDVLDVTILGALNILTPPATRGLRVVELEVTTPAGIFMLTREALLQGTSALVVGHNSFCTYHQAVLAAQDFSSAAMEGWRRAELRDERERALIEAWGAIMQLPLQVNMPRLDPQSAQSPVRYGRRVWLRQVPAESFLEVVGDTSANPSLLGKLALAQLLEASEVLNADPVTLARRNGLMSMTVGESSQFFGQSKPLEYPTLSRQAVMTLAPWLNYSVQLGRA